MKLRSSIWNTDPNTDLWVLLLGSGNPHTRKCKINAILDSDYPL
jgi:hypothetical protein